MKRSDISKEFSGRRWRALRGQLRAIWAKLHKLAERDGRSGDFSLKVYRFPHFEIAANHHAGCLGTIRHIRCLKAKRPIINSPR